MKLKSQGFCLLLSLCFTQYCWGLPPDPWTGTWKVNNAKSEVPGPTFTASLLSSGEYEINTGTGQYRYRCDGKEYPVINKKTVMCLQTSATKMDTVSRDNGQVTGTAHRELSNDGRTLTVTVTRLTGTKEVSRIVYVRVSASAGFAGAWKDTNETLGPEVMETNMTNSTLHLAYPKVHQYAELNLNGSDSPLHGGNVPAGVVTLSAKPQGPRQMVTTKKVNGQVVNEGLLTLSADGRTLVEEWWRPANPAAKGHRVYDKQ